MKMMKRVSSLVLALLLVLSLSVTAFAAESSVTYSGHKIFSFKPGSEYTLTDLFDNFKGIMPGDELYETITVKNTATCCDYIKVYMYAKTHSEDANEMQRTLKAAGETSETDMNDFLAQLDMQVWNDGKKIYDDSPDQADGLENKVLLGKFYRGKGTELTVKLTVPSDLGNEYANREGEVDWVFVVEEYINDVPRTGDHNNTLPYILAMGIGVAGMLVLFFGKRKKKQAN